MLNFILMFVIMVFAFGILIFIHEFGHFITARWCGVAVNEFAIGMGPRLFSWKSKKYDTTYALRLFPIGGFVSMVGEDEASEDENAFCNKSVWRRMLIVLAGPLMNLLLGVLLTAIIVLSQGVLGSTTVAEFSENSLSSQKLQVEDTIVKVGNTRVHTWNELAYEIMNQGYEPIDLTVLRDGERIVLEDVEFPTFFDSGANFGDLDFLPYAEHTTFPNVIKHIFFRSVSNVKTVIDSLAGLIGGRYGMEAVSGPIGVADAIGDVAQSSGFNFLSALSLASLLTMNLGVFNLIPFPALDGGRFLFLIIEGIRRKPVNRNIEGYINFVGIVILFAFMIVVTFKDIIKLIF